MEQADGGGVRVASAIAEALTELGVTHAFGLLGSGNFEVTQGLVARGVRFVAARHEGGAIVMADAYARVSGRVGICTVHQGPGVTNTATGLTEAAKSRTPLLLLAADTPAAAPRSNFRIDQAGLARSVGAAHARVESPETAVADVARAWSIARADRRPVLVSMPIDVQAALAAPAALPVQPAAAGAPAPDAASVDAVADLLAGAERPLLIAGRGAVLAGAREPLEALAGAAGALLATSAVGNGLFAGSPWSLGISGGFASPFAAELIRSADLVVSFGATLNMWTTRHGRLLSPTARVAQVDVEADAIGAHHRADVGVVGDAAAAARAVAAALAGRAPRSRWRTPELRAEIARRRWRDEPYEDAGDGARLDPRTLAIALDDRLPDERLIAVDSGHFMGWLPMYCRVPDERGFVMTQAFQAVGLGLATAIGAAVAAPDRLTVAALGDGGALMALPELETVARLALPMLIVVFNDAAYGAEVHHFGPDGFPVDLVRFPETDFAALARAAGAEGATVRTVADLDVVGRWLGDRSRPLVLDAKVVPTVVAQWLAEAFGH